MIVIGDFSENYSFVVQDEVQGYHWVNNQATLHPFVAYYKSPDNVLRHKSYCIISDCLDHSTFAVYTYQKLLVKHLKENLPVFNKLFYFSDGCAGQ